MRFNYTLYPEARQKLDSAGITERVQKAKKDYSIDIKGCTYEDEIPGMITEMKEEGFFKTFPKDQLKSFQEKMNAIFKSRDKFNWIISKNDKPYHEEVDIDDIVLMLGWDASKVLKPEEIWDYKKFGFENTGDFVGSVGSLINEVVHDAGGYRQGHKWQNKTPDNRILVNEVTGDSNCDMRIYQRDVTAYSTMDPFGNKVTFRPEIDPDRGGIMAYHSTEGEFLATILRYVEQRGIKPESLEDGAKKTLEWAASLGQGGGTCTEHFGGFDRDARRFFPGWKIPLWKLDKNNSTDKHSIDGIIDASGGVYMAYLNADENLVFSYESRDKERKSEKNVCAIFYPDDADHLIKGLIYQSAKGLGRTSCRQLINILEYRFSGQFEIDMREQEERFNKISK